MLTFAVYLSRISSLEVQANTFVFFSCTQHFCSPFPKGNSFHVEKKKKPPYYFSALTDKPPIALQTLWEPAFLHKTQCVQGIRLTQLTPG